MRTARQVDILDDGSGVALAPGGRGDSGVPMFSYQMFPYETVEPGYLSIHNNYGNLDGNLFKQAFAKLLWLTDKGDNSIMSIADGETTAANEGACKYFALDQVAKVFRIPWIPIDKGYGNTNIGELFFTELASGSPTGTIITLLEGTATEDIFMHATFVTITQSGNIDLYVNNNRVDFIQAGATSEATPGILSTQSYIRKGQTYKIIGRGISAQLDPPSNYNTLFYKTLQPIGSVQIKIYGQITNEDQIDLSDILNSLLNP